MASPMASQFHIGLDFDNTIAGYDKLISELAIEHGWLEKSQTGSKRQTRDALRALPQGEDKWQTLQAEIYGPRMQNAALMKGIPEFLSVCYRQGVKLSIISHKTEFANFGPQDVNLRIAALDWMSENSLLSKVGPGVPPDRVFFASTRNEKIELIIREGCTHFIDDLIEVFDHPAFPDHVQRYLFAPDGGATAEHQAYQSWQEIEVAIFGA
jgi:hypothetical protein